MVEELRDSVDADPGAEEVGRVRVPEIVEVRLRILK